jgi:hypothetical protein
LRQQRGIASGGQADNTQSFWKTTHYIECLPAYGACRPEDGQSLYFTTHITK